MNVPSIIRYLILYPYYTHIIIINNKSWFFSPQHLYPINELRNIGLQQVKTTYCTYIDIDLLPNPTLYQDLKEHIKNYLHHQHYKVSLIFQV